MKAISIDFYEVASKPDLHQAMLAARNLRGDARNLEFRDGAMRLRRMETRDDLLVGDMMRIRLHEPTIIASMKGGERAASDNIDDEGLGETNAFIYSHSRKLLAYQRNRSGIAADHAAFYFQEKGKSDKAFEFVPVLKPVAMSQLHRMATPSCLHLKVVAPSIKPEEAKNAALGDVIDALNTLGGLQVDVTFSMGRQRQSGMRIKAIVEMVQRVLRLRENGTRVDALEVKGRALESNKSELLDFVDARFSISKKVDPTPLLETFFNRRVDCLLAAWEEAKEQLR